MNNKNTTICPICGSKVFVEYNSSNKRMCAECHSLERTRTFAKLFESDFKDSFPPNGKNMHVSPSNVEKKFMRSRNIDVITIDVRPELKTDIVADICNMPQIKQGSFDSILACCVLNHVYDDNSALTEFHRVLKTDGSLFLWVQESGGEHTIEYDHDKIIGWYGAENYEKYKVGTYRMYGPKDLTAKLKSIFGDVKCYEVSDDITGENERGYKCVK